MQDKKQISQDNSEEEYIIELSDAALILFASVVNAYDKEKGYGMYHRVKVPHFMPVDQYNNIIVGLVKTKYIVIDKTPEGYVFTFGDRGQKLYEHLFCNKEV